VFLGSVGEFGSGAGDAVEAGRESTIRAHRSGVGPAGAPAASDDTPVGWPLAGSPPGPQWHLVPGAYRGVPWRDLPDRYGPWETVYKRFARWQTDGTWARIEAALRSQAEGRGSWTGMVRLTPAWSELTSTPPGPARGARLDPGKSPASAGTVTGWADDQAPHHRRRSRPEPGDPAHARPGCRHHPAGRAGGRRAGGPPGWSGPAADPGGLAGRGQGLQQSDQPGGTAGPPHPPHHPGAG
jgi:hypothetical protein